MKRRKQRGEHELGSALDAVMEKAIQGGRAAAKMMPIDTLCHFAGNMLAMIIAEQLIEQGNSKVASARFPGSDIVKSALDGAGVEFGIILDLEDKNIKIVMREKGGEQ